MMLIFTVEKSQQAVPTGISGENRVKSVYTCCTYSLEMGLLPAVTQFA